MTRVQIPAGAFFYNYLFKMSIVAIPDFLSPEECEQFIQQYHIHASKVVRTSTRYRYGWLDNSLASEFWQRLQYHQVAPATGQGCNPFFRLNYYRPGDHFPRHIDACHYVNDCPTTHTLMVYLNTVSTGGATNFYHLGTVQPQQGLAVLFPIHLWHEGLPVYSDKYVLRTDVVSSKPYTQEVSAQK